MVEVVYLDNAATTRPLAEVVEAVRLVMTEEYGNPSSRHGLGLAAERAVDAARAALARVVGGRPDEIVFTSGGSEANNLALKGVAWAYARAGNHLVLSAVEHPSLLETAAWLKTQGLAVTLVPVGADGRVDPAALLDAVTEQTLLVSLMHVNNEVGAVQPVAEVGRGLGKLRATSGRRKGLPLFHVDAVQSLARLPVDVHEWGVDLLSVSGHKVHGPKGVGALWVRAGVRLVPLIHGGGQEAGLRSGTENVAGIAGFGAALQALAGPGRDVRETARRLAELRGRLLGLVREGCSRVVVNGPESGPQAAPHILSLSFPGIPAEVLQHHLEEAGVYVSTGSACSSHHRDRVSHVLRAMGRPAEAAVSAVRLSLSVLTTQEEIDRAGRVIGETVRRLSREGEAGRV